MVIFSRKGSFLRPVQFLTFLKWCGFLCFLWRCYLFFLGNRNNVFASKLLSTLFLQHHHFPAFHWTTRTSIWRLTSTSTFNQDILLRRVWIPLAFVLESSQAGCVYVCVGQPPVGGTVKTRPQHGIPWEKGVWVPSSGSQLCGLSSKPASWVPVAGASQGREGTANTVLSVFQALL